MQNEKPTFSEQYSKLHLEICKNEAKANKLFESPIERDLQLKYHMKLAEILTFIIQDTEECNELKYKMQHLNQ